MIAPTTDDAAQQVRAVEDLIAKKVDVIGVIPNDGAALEPVFKRAQDAGIKVIVHEQPGQKNADWDIELIQNQAIRRSSPRSVRRGDRRRGQIRRLRRRPHGRAAQSLGRLRGRPAKAEIPEDAADRRPVRRLKQRRGQLQDGGRPDAAIPDLKGFLIFGANGPIGAGQAVADRDKIGKVIVVGPFIPSQGQN